MFNESIVKKVLESALICRKEDRFKYVNLSDQHLNQFSKNFLEEDTSRILNVCSDDVYSFISKKLETLGYSQSNDSIFLDSSSFSKKDLFLESFAAWTRLNPNTPYLIPSCHATNLEILETLINLFDYNLDKSLLERLSLDLQFILSDVHYISHAKDYEYFILALLSECTSGAIFSNILAVSSDENFKKQVYDTISGSPNRGAISIEVTSSLGVNNVPSNVLQSYIEFVNPAAVNIDMFLSILNSIPLTNFTAANSDSSNPVFTKYVSIINNYIQTNSVNAELIERMLRAASPSTPNGWKLLSLLNEACLAFSPTVASSQPATPVISTPASTVNCIPGSTQAQPLNPTIPTAINQTTTDFNATPNEVEVVSNIDTDIVPEANHATVNGNTFNAQGDYSQTLNAYKQPQFGEAHSSTGDQTIPTAVANNESRSFIQ